MKVVMVAPFGLQPKGTVRGRALPLAAALVARGHEVTLLVPPWDDRAAAGRTTIQDGVRVEQLPLPRKAWLDLPYLLPRLLLRALSERPDVLHAFKPKAYSGFLATAWGALRAGNRGLAPVVMDSDDWEGWGGWNDIAPYSTPQKHLFAWQERWGLRHANGVTVASRALEQIVLGMGVEPTKVAYIPNGPGAPWPTPPAEEVERLARRLNLVGAPVALLFTRFFEFDTARLASRWAEVVAEIPEARLLVVGKGLHGEEERFREAIAARGVTSSVVDVGWQRFDALPALFALARVALYPMDDTLLNRSKCPLKLADLLQVGVPVVGEGVGQVSEYLAHGRGGLLTPPGDDAAFVAATVRLLRDASVAAELGRAGQEQIAAEFEWPIQAARVEALYERLKG